MPIQFSAVVPTRPSGGSGAFAVQSLDLDALGAGASPIVVFDDFRVRGRPFGPHPHAGFSAVTYVFEDSPGALRSRDSLGNDVVVGPGGIVWTQAASGVIHEETPAERDRELHGLQVFVNLSARNKLGAPKMLRLVSSEVPEWRSQAGDRVRVVVGSFQGVSSPLVPAEPFTFLDLELRREASFDLPLGHDALVYVRAGVVAVRAGDQEQTVSGGHAVALHGGSGRATFAASGPTNLVLLSGANIAEPLVVNGPFIMNDRAEVDAAVVRYRAGKMGQLAPRSD